MNNDLKYATVSPVFHWACVLMILALFPVAELPFGIVKSVLAALLFTLVGLAMLFSVGPGFVTRREAEIANKHKARPRGMVYASKPIGSCCTRSRMSETTVANVIDLLMSSRVRAY